MILYEQAESCIEVQTGLVLLGNSVICSMASLSQARSPITALRCIQEDTECLEIQEIGDSNVVHGTEEPTP